MHFLSTQLGVWFYFCLLLKAFLSDFRFLGTTALLNLSANVQGKYLILWENGEGKWARKSERIKSQLLPHLAQITAFLLSRPCVGREALLERSLGRRYGGGKRERVRERERQEGRWAEGKREKNGETHKVCEKKRFPVKFVCREKTKWEKPTVTSSHLGVKLNRQTTRLWRHAQNYNLLSISSASTHSTDCGKFFF